MAEKATRSGNPAKKAAAKKAAAPSSPTVSSVASFKKRAGGLLELPSGSTVRVQNAGGLRAFVQGGSIPNSLMPIVEAALTGKPVDPESLLGDEGEVDEKMIADMVQLMDIITMNTIKEPQVHPVPEDEADRRDDLLYVDELDDEDKMFVFQWVTGGTSDLERFRQESASTLDDLATRSAAKRTTKQPARTRSK